eukprot:660191-Amphidinium_carterae.2
MKEQLKAYRSPAQTTQALEQSVPQERFGTIRNTNTFQDLERIVSPRVSIAYAEASACTLVAERYLTHPQGEELLHGLPAC